jgi:hypothetical protein
MTPKLVQNISRQNKTKKINNNLTNVDHVKKYSTLAFIFIKFHMLSKQKILPCLQFFSFGRTMICSRSSHILRNISTTFMTRIIYILSSWLLCRLRDQVDILGCIMGLWDRQPWSLHKHHQQCGPELYPELYASSFQECDAKLRLGWDRRDATQRHDFMDHSHP